MTIFKKISKQLDRARGLEEKWLEDICRNHVKPVISGEITIGKLKWRGIVIMEERSFENGGCVITKHVSQRGEKVGPYFTVSFVVGNRTFPIEVYTCY